MAEEIKSINKLPAKTWYWLDANEAKFTWDEEKEVKEAPVSFDSKKDSGNDIHIAIKSEGEYSSKEILLEAFEGETLNVFMTYDISGSMAVFTKLILHKDSKIKLVQATTTREGAKLYNKVEGNCEAGAKTELIQISIGEGDVYLDSRVDLTGDESSLEANIGYLGMKKQIIDVNVFANHVGKKTECEINANGALLDAAKKTFRGTIDFKRGASDSVGNEMETVLMLGDDVVNKTIPLILCAEEDVVGNHGATIGELDDDTLFYFETRGISREEAEYILAKAAIERVANLAEDDEISRVVDEKISEKLKQN